MNRARKYNKQIELWQTIIGDDGYGGSIRTSDVLITTTKCRIETFNLGGKYSNRSIDLGLTDTTNAIKILLRKRKDLAYNSLNQFFVYAGEKYTIQNQPLDINYFGTEIEIIAVKEIVKTSTNLDPING